jgi:hypothetical protein
MLGREAGDVLLVKSAVAGIVEQHLNHSTSQRLNLRLSFSLTPPASSAEVFPTYRLPLLCCIDCMPGGFSEVFAALKNSFPNRPHPENKSASTADI